MDKNQNQCKELYLYYRFLLRNLKIDINAMSNSLQSPKVLQKRKFKKSKKTTLNEIISKGEYTVGKLTPQEREITDAITNRGNLNDLLHKFYKMGIIVAYAYFEAYNKDMMRVLDNTSDYERYNILSSLGNNKDIEKINDKLEIDVKTQYSNWNSLIEGYIMRNMIVHSNGEFDKDFIRKMSKINTLVVDKINRTKNPAVDYKHAFEDIIFVIDYYFEFILEKMGLRVCCVCKRPFEDKPENLDYAPICQECHNKSGE